MAPPVRSSRWLPSVAQRVTLQMQTGTGNEYEMGSGVILTADRLILTNARDGHGGADRPRVW
jgi:hypothetical protein